MLGVFYVVIIIKENKSSYISFRFDDFTKVCFLGVMFLVIVFSEGWDCVRFLGFHKQSGNQKSRHEVFVSTTGMKSS